MTEEEKRLRMTAAVVTFVEKEEMMITAFARQAFIDCLSGEYSEDLLFDHRVTEVFRTVRDLYESDVLDEGSTSFKIVHRMLSAWDAHLVEVTGEYTIPEHALTYEEEKKLAQEFSLPGPEEIVEKLNMSNYATPEMVFEGDDDA